VDDPRLVRLDLRALARVGATNRVLALSPAAWGTILALPADPPLTLRTGAARALATGPAFASRGPGGDDDDDDETDDGDDYVALVPVRGPLVQREEADLCGFVAGYDGIAARMIAALDDPKCVGVVLVIDSPGGDAAGLEEAATRVARVRDASGKPVAAYVDELAASGGYWLATSMANAGIYLPRGGGVGSIGAFTAHVDESAALEQDGFKVTLVQDPPGKTAGTPTEPLDDVGRARMVARVADVTSRFMSAVAAARGMSVEAVRELDGAVVYGPAAVAAGLADDVATLEQTISKVASAAAERNRNMNIRSTLAALIHAPSDATDEQLERGAKAAGPLVDLGRAALVVTGTKDPAEATAKISAWQAAAARVADLEAKLEDEGAKKAEKRRLKAVVSLVTSGRIKPAEAWADPTKEPSVANLSEPWASMDLGVLRAMSERLTASETVQTPPAKSPASTEDGGALVSLTAEELHYAKVMKLDPKKLAAHKAEEQARRRAEIGGAA
jgi:ClpP class serine protease